MLKNLLKYSKVNDEDLSEVIFLCVNIIREKYFLY